MTQVLILVEGQTEELFVNQVLGPHLHTFAVYPRATCICTSKVQGRRQHRGGHAGKYEPIRRDLFQLLKNPHVAVVSTMIDFYGLPSDFPGKASQPTSDCFQQVKHLEQSFAADVQDPRFIPFLMLHEYEALLFASPEAIADAFPGNWVADLKAIRDAFDSPEEIDDSPQTAPSKRLEALLTQYRKAYHGPLIAEQIGLLAIRNECRHFADWVTRLESFGTAATS